MESLLLLTVSIVAGLVLLIGLLSALAPTRIAYSEEVTIGAVASEVYDDIRLQDRLMRWSAWPRETKSTRAVDVSASVGGADGAVGARTVFFSKGKRIGHQELVALEENRSVAFVLEGAGPPHRPRMTFRLEPLGESQTRAVLDFVNDFPRPFNVLWHFAGLSRWTRKMHRLDLAGLKAFCEPPHRDADGNIVGRPPASPNPYAQPMPDAA